MVVYHGGKQVVGGGDGVNVAGKVEVDFVHRNNLRAPAARSTAFDAETGAERGFAQREGNALFQALQGIGQTYGNGGFAFAGRGRGQGGNEDEGAARRRGTERMAAVWGRGCLGFGEACRSGDRAGGHGAGGEFGSLGARQFSLIFAVRLDVFSRQIKFGGNPADFKRFCLIGYFYIGKHARPFKFFVREGNGAPERADIRASGRQNGRGGGAGMRAKPIRRG